MTPEELQAHAAEMGLALVETSGMNKPGQDVNPFHRSVAVGAKGQSRESVRIDMGAGHDEKNNVIQFDINNSQGGAVAEVVRIGSVLGMADAYIRFGTTKSAADSVNGISDNFGVNVQQCQGFSEMSISTPKFIKTIKLISSDITQLNKQFSHKTILPDFTIVPLNQNIAFTKEKSDFDTTLLVAKGSWLLSSKNFLEFQSVVGQNITVILELASISDVRQFVKL